MREGRWLGVLVLLALAGPAWAQRTITFGGPDPSKIVNQPVNTGATELPIARPIAAPQTTGIGFNRFFPKIVFPSANPVRGQSVFPTPSNMPGPNYLQYFNVQYPKPVTQEDLLGRRFWWPFR
jgi:hypothetical protein